jgi:hypothetical protein
MWRETNIFGIYVSPLLVYALVALLLWLPLRYVMIWLRLGRWLDNPAIAQLTLYLCLLAALVTWL